MQHSMIRFASRYPMATLSVPLSSTVKIPMSSENHPLLDETYLGVTKIIIQTNVPLFLIMKAQKHRTDLIGLARATLAFVYELDNLFEITRVASLNKLVSSTHERVQQTNLASTATYLGRFFGRRASVHSLHSPLFSVNGVFCKRRWRLGFVTLDFFLSASNKLPTYGAAGAHPQKSHNMENTELSTLLRYYYGVLLRTSFLLLSRVNGVHVAVPLRTAS